VWNFSQNLPKIAQIFEFFLFLFDYLSEREKKRFGKSKTRPIDDDVADRVGFKK